MMDSTDVVVIGSGLAGLVVALCLMDSNGSFVGGGGGGGSAGVPLRVTILEKEARAGMGNSIKASSGINADSTDIPQFRQDTVASAGDAARPHLIEPLVNGSQAAVDWLRKRLEVDLSEVAQLGGHSTQRTHRPGNLPIGAELMGKLRKAVEEKASSGNEPGGGGVTITTNAKATKLLTDAAGRVTGVEYEVLGWDDDGNQQKETKSVSASHVVVATGGFAADRNLLAKYRPELVNFPSTQGPFSTGDGILLGDGVEAAIVDMDKIQVHPTGFVDPKDPDSPNKFLAAEVLRGVGGLLLNANGERFCNELGRRDYVTEQVLSLNPQYAQTKQWDAAYTIPKCHLVLSVAAASEAGKHIEFYAWKGFLKKVEGCQGVAESIGCPVDGVRKTLEEYQKSAQAGVEDKFGKMRYMGVPSPDDEFYVGTVTPVLHYCMGGLQIDAGGNVLGKNGTPITGLYACGETSGGVHGNNRLAGNSLLECVVYGTIVSQNILRSFNG